MHARPAGRHPAIEVIHARQSVRRGFREGSIPDEMVMEILQCGCMAPSSKDAQHWRLHAVRDRSVLVRIADAMAAASASARYVPLDPGTGQPRDAFASSVLESAAVLRSVALGVFVEDDGSFSGGRDAVVCSPTNALGEVLVGYCFELIGLGATIQNMWLAAHALGLAGVYLGDVLIVEEHVRAELAMAGDLVGVLALGTTDAPRHAAKVVKAGRIVLHPER